jgi:methyl-accepting chemotaxis protein
LLHPCPETGIWIGKSMMFIGVKIVPRTAVAFAPALLALIAVWGLAAHGLRQAATALAGRGAPEAVTVVDNALALVHAAGVLGLLAAAWAGWLLARSITTPLAKAVRSLETVAQGDLTHTAAVASKDEIGRLFGAIHGMRQSLGVLVGEVRAGAASVADASAQVASGNLDLSNRTEEQAGTLQQTAASIDELTSTVARNAEHAREASRLAGSASTVASQGGKVVGQVVGTMGQIADASRRISEIIGVIDGIASRPTSSP